MTLDDRDTYRMMSDRKLLLVAREEGVTAEMAVVLAERLSSVYTASPTYRMGNFQPRSIKA